MGDPGRVVGVRELKSRLSAFLREVASGRIVVVADRAKRPIARIVPVTGVATEAAIERLAGLGRARPGLGKPGGCKPVRAKADGRTASDVVIEERR